MGSPVSVTIANLVMEDIEQRALTTFRTPLQFWKRYVDDTYTTIQSCIIEEFHQHLNSIEPSIQFTYEIEQNNQLPFLDILLNRQDDGSILTSVFRKSTHTDRYLHFDSHHPQSHKQSVVRTLFSRAESLSSCPSLKSIEELHVSKALQDNGYPERFIHSSRLPRPRPISPAETEGLTTLTLPYLKGPSEPIRRVLEPLNVRTFFRPTRTLRQILCHPKDPVPDHQQAGVVYKIPCSDCSKSYIGQTGRTLAQRVKEHQRAVRTFDVNISALAEHVISTNHKIDWDNTTVIDRHAFTHPRCTMESWHIHQEKDALNREKGLLPDVYLTLQSSHKIDTQPNACDTEQCV